MFDSFSAENKDNPSDHEVTVDVHEIHLVKYHTTMSNLTPGRCTIYCGCRVAAGRDGHALLECEPSMWPLCCYVGSIVCKALLPAAVMDAPLCSTG